MKKSKPDMRRKRGATTSTGKKPSLSVCMIVKNEESMLRQCLASVAAIADEIIVVDTGSTDQTMAVAREFGARVYEHPWQKNFSLHRNQSLGYATGDWVFQIDADEVLQAASAETLLSAIRSAPPEVNGFMVLIHDYRQTGEQTVVFNYPRIYRTGVGVHYEGIVHNQVLIPGKVNYSAVHMDHFGYDLDPKTMLRKFKRSVSLLRKLVKQNPSDPSPLYYLANAYSQYRKYEKAIVYARLAIDCLRREKINSLHFLSVYYPLITSLIKLERFDEAREACLEALALKPDYIDSYYHLSRLSYMEQKFDDAIRFGNEYLRLYSYYQENPGRLSNLNFYSMGRTYRLHYWLGTSLIATGQIEAGMRLVEQSLASEFADHYLAIEMVHNALAVANLEIAKKITQHAARRFGADGNFVLLLAQELAEDDLLGWMPHFLQANPPGFKSMLGKYGEAALHLLLQNTDRAVATLRSIPTGDETRPHAEHLLLLLDDACPSLRAEARGESRLAVVALLLHRAVQFTHAQECDCGDAQLAAWTTAHGFSGELSMLQHLMTVVDGLRRNDMDRLLDGLTAVAELTNVNLPEEFSDLDQLVELLVAFAREADNRLWPDAATLVLAIADSYIAEDVQLQLLKYRRQFARADRNGPYDERIRLFFRYLFPIRQENLTSLLSMPSTSRKGQPAVPA